MYNGRNIFKSNLKLDYYFLTHRKLSFESKLVTNKQNKLNYLSWVVYAV